MTITTTCPGCNALFRLPAELAGQEVRCQTCERLFTVPAPPATGEAPPPEAPPAPAPAIASTPPAEPAPAVLPARKTPAPVEQPASLLAAAILLAVFFVGVAGVITASALWVHANLAPVARVTVVFPPTPVFGPVDVDQPIGGNQKAAVPTPIHFDFNGKKTLNDRTMHPLPGFDHGRWGKAGPYRAYRIHLVQNTTYNFYITSFGGFTPRLEIFEGDQPVANRTGVFPGRVMLSYRPKKTADHVLLITAPERVAGPFFMSIAPEEKAAPIAARLGPQGLYASELLLRVDEPLELKGFRAATGPYRDYDVFLEANQEYAISVSAATFRPLLRIDEKAEHSALPGRTRLDIIHRAGFTGNHRMRVSSEQYGLGKYIFTITRRGAPGVSPQPQNIIAVLDAENRYEDKRAFNATDPPEPAFAGRGAHKVYLVRLEKGSNVTLELTSNTFDPYLAVYDPDQKQIATALSKLGACNARLTFRAPDTGTYRIHAAASRPKELGAYQFKILPD